MSLTLRHLAISKLDCETFTTEIGAVCQVDGIESLRAYTSRSLNKGTRERNYILQVHKEALKRIHNSNYMVRKVFALWHLADCKDGSYLDLSMSHSGSVNKHSLTSDCHTGTFNGWSICLHSLLTATG